MTSDTSADVKEVIFINRDAAEAYGLLPPDVRETANASEIPTWQSDRLEKRLADVRRHYEQNRTLLTSRYKARQQVRHDKSMR